MVRTTGLVRLFVLVGLCYTGIAGAASVTPALKTQYRYFSVTQFNYGVNLGCFGSESAVISAMLQLAGYTGSGKCDLAFRDWANSWPNSKGLTGGWDMCPPPAGVPYVGGWNHVEGRDANYNYSSAWVVSDVWQCAHNGPFVDGFQVDKEYYYSCPTNYHLINYVVGQEPLCQLDAGIPDPNKTHNCDHCVGDPISTGTGFLIEHEVDYPGVPNSGLNFARWYRARNWHHTYERTLTYSDVGAGASYVSVTRPDGGLYTFQRSSTSAPYASDADVTSELSGTFDASGNPTGWTYTDTDDSTETYDGNGFLLTITTRTGLHLNLTYDSSMGRLATVTDDFGHQLSFAYDSQGRLGSVTVPGSQQYTYTYDTAGNLASVTYPDSTSRSYLYNESGYAPASPGGLLTGIVDEASQRYLSAYYDTSGRATRSEHSGGADRTDVAYNADGTTTVTDTAGATHTVGYVISNSTKLPTSVSGSHCSGCNPIAAYSYDTQGFTTSTTDFRGDKTTYSDSGETTRQLQTLRTEGLNSVGGSTPSTRSISTQWHSTFRVPMTVTEPNRTTSYTRDASGNALTRTVTDTSVTPNVSRTWTYTYNTFGRVLTEDGPRSDVSDLTTYTYYTCTTGAQCGQLHNVTNALGHVTSYDSYNASGQPTQITDANGLVTSIGYDSRQRLSDRCVGAVLPSCTGGELTHLDYWATGLLKKVTNPDGGYLQYTYDNAHRVTQINDGAGNKVVYTLDSAGNRTAENSYDPSLSLKRTHTRVFNTLNQLWKEVNAAGTAAVTTTFGYDAQGNQTTVNAPLARNSASTYDELNRLKQITDPNSGNTQFGYDANDNLVSVTDPRTLTTSYSYTGFGDLKTQTSPDTGLTTNTYDSGGNLKTSTDARSAITTYAYDALNRVTSAAYKIGTTTDQTITYTYDAGTNGIGHLTSAADANHGMSWIYDAQGRVIAKGQTVGAISKSMSYTYNVTGQLASVTLPSGVVIQYGYNSNNQVTSVTLLGSPNVPIVSNVTYDPFGPVTGWTWGSGRFFTRTFDTDGKLTGVSTSFASVGNRAFGYDDAFRITSTTDTGTSGLNWTLSYDILDRLNSATKTGTTIGYTYDANGNRLTQTGTSASTYAVSGTSNRLSSVSGALVRSYSYDSAGNSLTTGATTHTYYNNGRMKTAKLGAASSTTYTYNVLGQRVKKNGPGGGFYYVYDEAGHLQGEYTSGGGTQEETVWLGDIPIATVRPNGSGGAIVYYVHTDQLNTPRKVTNNNSSLTLRWSWDPTPFGEGAANDSPTGLSAFSYNLRFPGQMFDAESGLNYNYYRDLDPAIGRYVQSDPIGLSAGVNTYAYVKGDSVSNADPLGLFAVAPPKPGINTIVCDGDGGIEPQLLTLDPGNELCGLGDCIRAHEMSHIEDVKKQNRSICKDKKKGMRVVASSKAESASTEIKAANAEIACLKKLLKGCDKYCDPLIRSRIVEEEKYRDGFK
jgi:RHS repeat-associated protein